MARAGGEGGEQEGDLSQDVVDVLLHLLEPDPPPERATKAGSRNRWPECGAMTKGKPGLRRPAPCRAAGAGVGARCRHHGGMALGAEYGSRRSGPRGRRRLVLLSGYDDLLDDMFNEPRDRRAWSMYAIPCDLHNLIDPSEFQRPVQVGYISHLLLKGGVPAKVAGRWPCKVGYRIVRLLVERGRIDHALLSTPRDLKRATRSNLRAGNSLRIEPQALLDGIRAAGRRLK